MAHQGLLATPEPLARLDPRDTSERLESQDSQEPAESVVPLETRDQKERTAKMDLMAPKESQEA